MVSDGVLESAKQEEKEEYFKKVIEQIKSVSPQEIANASDSIIIRSPLSGYKKEKLSPDNSPLVLDALATPVKT